MNTNGSEPTFTKSLYEDFDENERVLSYEDYVLYGCDLRSLKEPNGWLTDNVINVAVAYLNSNIQGKTHKEVIIVPAALCEIIKNGAAEEVNQALCDAGVAHDHFCLFILNDNTRPGVPMGGAHWTLLLYNPNGDYCKEFGQTFYFFDSIPSANGEVYPWTQEFVDKVKKYFKRADRKTTLTRYWTPAMLTSGDCGIYAIEYARVILESLFAYYEAGIEYAEIKFSFHSSMNPAYMQQARQMWLEIFEDVRRNSL